MPWHLYKLVDYSRMLHELLHFPNFLFEFFPQLLKPDKPRFAPPLPLKVVHRVRSLVKGVQYLQS